MERAQSSSLLNSEYEQPQTSSQSNSAVEESGSQAMEKTETSSQICRDMLDISREITGILFTAGDHHELIIYAIQYWHFRDVVDDYAEWIREFENKTQSICPMAIGKKLLGVLNRGMQLIRQSAEAVGDPNKLLSIVLGAAGEFYEILDDVRRYCGMIVQCCPIDKVHLIQNFKTELEKKWKTYPNNTLLFMFQCGEQQLIADLTTVKQPTKFLTGLISWLETETAPVIAENDLSITTETLGIGGFGIVRKAVWYKAIEVAVKEFHNEDYFQDEYNQFMKLRVVESPHIVRMLGHSEIWNGKDESRKVLVMELMDMNLERKIRERPDRPFSLEEAIDIMLQIVMGMRTLHGYNVIYKDLKPANILVKERDDGSLNVKLADFGAAEAEFLKPHRGKGTRLYMAPELAAGGTYTRNVDVYSFGLVCIEILTRRILDSAITLQLQHNQTPSLPQYVPRNLYTIIWRCLHQEEHTRPSFEEIFDRLWDVKESVLMEEVESESESEPNFKRKLMPDLYSRISDPTCKKLIYLCPSLNDHIEHLALDILTYFVGGPLGFTFSGQVEVVREEDPFFHYSAATFQSELGISLAQLKSRAMDMHEGKKSNISLVVGGWNNSRFFSAAFSSYQNRTRFTNSLLQFCRIYPIFDGLVIDWMYVSDDGINYGKEGNIVSSEDGENFIFVLEQLRSALPSAFLITVTCDRTEARWPIERAVHLIDQIFLRNSFSSGQETAHHTANLYSTSHQRWSMDESIQYYVSKGIHSSRIYIEAAREPVGFSNTDDIGKPATRGIPSDLQVSCFSQLIDVGFVEKWDEEAKAPYANHPTRRVVCVYDNIQSIMEKAHYVKTKNLGGIFIGHCCAHNDGCSMFRVAHDHL